MTQTGATTGIRIRLTVMALAAAVLLIFASPASADQPTLFEVREVAVDVTADSAALARASALGQGERLAFSALLRRLTLVAYHDRLPGLGQRAIQGMILDFEVADEKASSVRYIAKLNYRFRAEAVRGLLDEHQIPYAETLSKPVLVLPVYQAAGALLLWDDPNPWRTAWGARPATVTGLVPTILPGGDLEDIRTIGAEQAIEGDTARLEEIALRYRAGDVIVVHGILRMDGYGGLPELESYMTRFGSALQEHTVVKTFSAEPGEDMDSLLTRAAISLTAQIEDNWKQDNLIQVGAPSVLSVTVQVNSLKDWVRVRDRLNGVAIVRDAELTLMSRKAVRLNLHFIGDAEQLALSLDQADLTLWQEAGDWYLGQRQAVR